MGAAVVFLFHCIQPFNPNEQWHIQNGDRSVILGYGISFLNLWIMQLFMLLAGASAYFALKQRKASQYMRERITRIFLPLVIGILVLVPPQVYAERRIEGRFTGGFLSFYPHFFDGVYPAGNFSWHHLWFLAYLFVYSVIALPLFQILKNYKLPKVFHRPWGLLLFAAPLAVFHVALFWKFPPKNNLVEDWGWHSQLFLVFVYGYLLVSDKSLEKTIQDRWRAFLNLAAGLTIIVFVLRVIPFSEDPNLAWAFYAVKAVFYRFCGWSWIVAILGWGRQRLNQPFPWLEAASREAYPFYILHQTVIVLIASNIVIWPFPIFIKFPLLLVTAGTCTHFLYQTCLKWPVTRIALGIKMPLSR